MASQDSDYEEVEFGIVCSSPHCEESTTVLVTPMRYNRAPNHFQINARLRGKGWLVLNSQKRYCPACRDDHIGVPE